MFEGKHWVWLVTLVSASLAASGKNVVCYYSSWATYRWSSGKFDVADVNVDLCTHLMYAFAGIDSQGAIISLDPYLDLPDNWGRNNYGAFTKLKEKNPKLKTILAIGGWNEGSAKYSVMASSSVTRNNFITSAISMITTHGFDGLDLDWEYPGRRDTVHGPADVDNFTLLIKELRAAFDVYGFVLTAAVSSVKEMASVSYDIPEISKYLDLINIMAYDMYGAWDPVTGHNAPLHRGIGDVGAASELYTVDVALLFWISQGAPLEKLALGVPFYGRTFTLTDPDAHSVRDPVRGPGISGTYTGTNGLIGYSEFCYRLKTESWTDEYDDLANVPYAYTGRDWVSYDDVNSITKKVEYAKSLNITNIMIWSIENDDFHNLCGFGEYPLLRAINTALDTEESTTIVATDSTTVSATTVSSTSLTSTEITTISTSSATTTSTIRPTTSKETTPGSTNEPSTSTVLTQATSSPATPICTEEGLTSNPTDCSSFYICVNNNGVLVAVNFLCPRPLHWDQANKYCNYPSIANCKV